MGEIQQALLYHVLAYVSPLHGETLYDFMTLVPVEHEAKIFGWSVCFWFSLVECMGNALSSTNFIPRIDCQSKHLVYCITCTKCKKQFVSAVRLSCHIINIINMFIILQVSTSHISIFLLLFLNTSPNLAAITVCNSIFI